MERVKERKKRKVADWVTEKSRAKIKP